MVFSVTTLLSSSSPRNETKNNTDDDNGIYNVYSVHMKDLEGRENSLNEIRVTRRTFCVGGPRRMLKDCSQRGYSSVEKKIS